MALRTRTIVDQRIAAVKLVESGVAVSEVAQRSGVSRQAVYNWIEQYRADPEAGLNAIARGGEPVGSERIDSSAWRVHYGSFVIGRFCSADKRLV
jgi:transposase-like protein